MFIDKKGRGQKKKGGFALSFWEMGGKSGSMGLVISYQRKKFNWYHSGKRAYIEN